MFRRSRRGPVVEEPVAGSPTYQDGAGVQRTTTTPAVAPATTAAVPAVPVSRGTGAMLGAVGFLTLLFGGWGGIVPFVGPLFGFHADNTPAWDWTRPHALLFLVPGAVAVLMGLAMIAAAPALSRGVTTGGPSLAGFLTVLCGAWFAIGPVAWPVLEGSSRVFAPASPLHELAYWVGYALGPGVLLAALGGTAMGIAAARRRAIAAMALQGAPAREVAVAA